MAARCPDNARGMSISILVLRTFFRSLFWGVFAWVFHFGARPPPKSIFNIQANICDRRVPQAREEREHLGLGSPGLCSVVVLRVLVWVSHFPARSPPKSIFNIENNFRKRRMPRRRGGREHRDFGSPGLCSVVVLGCVVVGPSLSLSAGS